MTTDDQDLLRRWRSHGEADAFRELVRRYAGLVFSSCTRVLGNASDAEDVAQECFIVLARTNDSIDVSLGGWLHAVATRRSIDRLRSDVRRRKREERFAESRVQEALSEWDSVALLVDECIEALPAQTRDLVVAYYLEQKSQEELAAELGLSQSAVSRRVAAGIDAVRDRMRRRGALVPAATIATGLAESATAAPATLVAALGKVAIGGGATHGAVTAVALGGGIAMKKVGIGAVVVAMLAMAAWWVTDSARPPLTERTRNVRAVRLPSPAASASTEDVNRLSGEEPTGDGPAEADGATAPFEAQPAVIEESETGAIRGAVVYADSGEPAVGWSVRLEPFTSGHEGMAETGVDGTFAFDGVPAGEYSVGPGWQPVATDTPARTIDLAPGETRGDLIFTVAEGGSIEGEISVGGSPLAESVVAIALLHGGINFHTRGVTTDVTGWYRLEGIQEGAWQFYAQIQLTDGASVWSNMPLVDIFAGETARVDFDFASGEGVLEGMVTLNQEPAARRDLVVTFYERSGNDVVGQVFLITGDDGAYALDGVPYDDVVVGAALMLDGRPIYPGPGGKIVRRTGREAVVDFEFTRASGGLEGVITVGGAPASVRRVLVSGQFVTTDEDGRYRVTGLQEGPFELWAELLTGEGKIFTTDRPMIEVATGEVREANFDFPAGPARLSGTVVTEAGAALTGRIMAHYADGRGVGIYHTARISTGGRFAIDSLPATTVELLFYPENGDPIPLPVAPVALSAAQTTDIEIAVPDHFLP